MMGRNRVLAIGKVLCASVFFIGWGGEKGTVRGHGNLVMFDK